jgi:hypothetical protein
MALPIHAVTLPKVLIGQPNGRLPTSILVSTLGQAGGPIVTLVSPAARAWRAMCAAALTAGHVLKATSTNDSYRLYSVQESLFRARYTTTHLANRPTKVWQGKTWWLRPGMATAAVPGTSNHGLALAVDIGEELDGDAGTEAIDPATVAWLAANAARFGFSAELQSEPWHWRYFAGDTIPQAVMLFEQKDETDMKFNESQKLDAVFNLYPTVKLDTDSVEDGKGTLGTFPVPITVTLARIEKKLDELLAAKKPTS